MLPQNSGDTALAGQQFMSTIRRKLTQFHCPMMLKLERCYKWLSAFIGELGILSVHNIVDAMLWIFCFYGGEFMDAGSSSNGKDCPERFW